MIHTMNYQRRALWIQLYMSSPEPHSLSKDVGSLLDPALSIESICQAVRDLPNEDKYDYLNNDNCF